MFDNFSKPSYLTNKKLSKKNKIMLQTWALEAYKLDPSHPVSYYYTLFDQRLKNKFIKEKKLRNFFKENTIEI